MRIFYKTNDELCVSLVRDVTFADGILTFYVIDCQCIFTLECSSNIAVLILEHLYRHSYCDICCYGNCVYIDDEEVDS